MLHKLSSYFTSVWNKFDMLAHSLFIVSVILRFTVSDDYFVWPRMSYCLTLSMYYIRFMQAFYVEKNIGPKDIMVRRMLTDILFFVCILLVFITAYGVASQALRFPMLNFPGTCSKMLCTNPTGRCMESSSSTR
ncbi:Transient receptor potential cation channel subfamily M member-like 2 [Lamellibrachia satsuma]|nr:Transient receptor potential cation channel subfamily M member-like 2 [Lamellibrachia satsuma]